jgi:hypothetical protein
MTQLLKHYLINRDTGKYALTIPSGYMGVNLEGLQIVHSLFTEDNVPYCLSTCPDTLEYSVTIPKEQLTEYQNNSDITIISSTQKEIEVTLEPTSIRTRDEDGRFIGDDPTTEQDEAWTTQQQNTTQIVYDLVYTKPHIVPETEGEGMKVITQQQWDDEIATFDNRQREKRYDILRKYRDRMLELTDWMVIRSTEQEEPLSLEFKTWRQELRNLPNSVEFPSGFPTLPTELENHTKIQELHNRFDEVRSVFMINDPLLVQ